MRTEEPKPRRPGFTLVEVVVATVLVGLALTATVISVRSNTQVNDAGTKLTQASFLAQEIREWTLSLPFTDPDPGDKGKPPGSDGSSPQVWVDDLDDLMNVTYCPPRDGQGFAITALPSWSQTITMTWRDPNNLSQTVIAGTSDVVCVKVDVKYRNKLALSSNWLVTRRPGE